MSGIKNNKKAELKEINGLTYRKCTCCNEFKTLDEFYSNCKNQAYWIDSICKDCRKKKSLARQREKHDEILLKKHQKKLETRGIQSPFNYIGTKYLLLPQILPLFPENINTFVDLFCGGCNVGINIKANKIICNDKSSDIINFYNMCRILKTDAIIEKIKKTIEKYSLNTTNVDNFNRIRSDFNQGKNNWAMFYTLVTYSYNQNALYTKNGKYTTGFGKNLCWFNPSLEQRIIDFANKIKTTNIDFINISFRDFNYNKLTKDDFVYCDPPYLISSKTYEWSEEDETDLLNILDKLNDKGIKFALSNVLKHKKGINTILFNWSRKYNIYRMQRNYTRMSRGKEKDTYSTEVLITNYK